MDSECLTTKGSIPLMIFHSRLEIRSSTDCVTLAGMNRTGPVGAAGTFLLKQMQRRITPVWEERQRKPNL